MIKKIFTALFLCFIASILIISCGKDKDENEPMLVVKYSFSNTQERLGNFGEPATIPDGHAAQSPVFHLLGVSSIELINAVNTLPTANTIIYMGEMTTDGGNLAIDFDKQLMVSHGEVLVKIPLKDITPGTYNYYRTSLGYQNYDINFIYNDATLGEMSFTGRIASFVGFNQYIRSFKVKNETVTVNANKLQGYFAYELQTPISTLVEEGQTPGTTVPNALPSSPIPAGSCLVTGEILQPLVITGNETSDIVINVSISVNKSFEWVEVNEDGKFEPLAGETVVDMGVRGLKVFTE
jgi:hypothetical protein